MYAVVETGGKQYKVQKGTKFNVEKLEANTGDTVSLPVILVESEGKLLTGDSLKNATVTAQVLKQGKDKKIIVFKYKAKKNIRKKQGHRQPFTTLLVQEIKA